MNVFKKVVALVCALVVMVAMTSPVAIAEMFIEAEGVQPIGGANETADLPVTLVDEEKPMSGKCGDNLAWVLNDEGTLTVNGTGTMYEGTFASGLPWHDRTDIKSVVINDGVEDIGRGAFDDCVNLSSVIIPDSVTSIHMDAFRGCSNLTSVILSDNITAIGAWAFYGSGLTTLTIPGSATGGDEVFAYCPNLKNVIIQDGFKTIGFCNFLKCQNLKTVSIPKSVDCIYYSAFSECSNLTDIYYAGTKDEWNTIKFVSYRGKNTLENTTIHFADENLNSEGETIGDKVDFDNHTYQLFAFKNITGKAVVSYCSEINGYMAHINDSKENEFLRKLICSNDVKYAYFGYSDEETEGEWQWVDGKTSQYTNWAAGEPNNEYDQEHYALINRNGYWNDGKFENDAANSGVVIICEFDTNTEVDVGDNTDTSSSNSESDRSESDDNSSIPQTDTNGNNTAKDDVSDNSNPGSNIITVPFKGRNVDFYWNDDLFSGSSFEYNNDLAIASLVLAGAAESKSDEGVKRILEEDMKFKDIVSSGNYDHFNVLQPAYIIGSKKIMVNDKEKNLISITIRGTTKFTDIITDVADGAIGFNSSVLFARNGLLEYINKYFNSVDRGNVILWISGHSLGGAVASSLGAYINDAVSFGNDFNWNTYQPENIYTYSFAPPSYTTITSIFKQHKNIFEIINRLDFVPDLGGPQSRHTGAIREFDPFEARDYANYYEEYTKKEFVPYFSRFPSTDYHACLAYMAFLKSGGEPTDVRPQKRFLLSVCCPVDVEVYGSDGKLLSRVTSNMCDENVTSDNVICVINGDKKYFIISTDDKCQVKLTGTDDGTMKYGIQKLKSTDEAITEEDFITYETVELENGKTFYSEISNNDDFAEVNLYVVDRETNKPVKSVGLDGKETNLVKESHSWLYIVGAILVVTVTVIIVHISYKRHKAHSSRSTL